jgi:hypothetical protein
MYTICYIIIIATILPYLGMVIMEIANKHDGRFRAIAYSALRRDRFLNSTKEMDGKPR